MRIGVVSKRFWLATFLVFGAFVAGCGDGRPTTYPAGGRVVFSDGSPLQGGNIEFAPKGGSVKTSARAMVEEDGTFRLSTFANGDGALAGEYRVSLIPARRRGEPGDKAARHISGKYQDANQSGLEATISPDSPNQFEFIVQSTE